MPLIAHTDLPTYERLAREGETVLSPDRAMHQDIRELHIGLLNMMPDAALEATERQFFRLVGESNQIAQFYMHPFSLPQIERSEKGRSHVERYYENVDNIKADGLDALIITGANVTQPDLSAEAFFEPLREVVSWAYENVTSTLCSCLATHAVLEFQHQKKRQRMAEKCWGVFPHRVVNRTHPLVNDVNTLFDVPHSRFNQVSGKQFKAAGLHVLVESEEAGVHLAVSPDQFRFVYFQGHPEYDSNSLLKEYKREVNLFIAGKREEYPPHPTHYFRPQTKAILDEYQHKLLRCLASGQQLPTFPESLVTATLDNTWHDTGEAVINNWIGKVYQITNNERSKPFMEGIDPQNPLAL